MPPTARPFWIILAVAGVWGLADVVWVVTGTPAPVVDYGAALAKRVAEAQPAGRNGWALFAEAAAMATAISERRYDEQQEASGMDVDWTLRPDYQLVRLEPLDRARLSEELEALEELAASGAIELLAEAVTCPRAVRPAPAGGSLMMQELPELSRFRVLAKMRACVMRLAADEGRFDEHAAAFEQMLALGRAAGSQSTFIERLVGMSIVSLAIEELRLELFEFDFPPEHCRTLRTALDRQMNWPQTSLVVEGERAMCLDLVQRVYTDDGHGSGRVDGRSDEVGAPDAFTGVFQADRATVVAKFHELFDGMAASADMPPAVRVVNGFDVAAFEAGLGARLTMVSNFTPALDRFIVHEDDFRTTVAGTRLLLALAEHRARHGDWPASQDDLVPDVLTAIPLDPACGKPFVYRRGPAAMPVICYSRGVDGVDDSADVDVDVEHFEALPFAFGVHLGDVLIIKQRTTWEETP